MVSSWEEGQEQMTKEREEEAVCGIARERGGRDKERQIEMGKKTRCERPRKRERERGERE